MVYNLCLQAWEGIFEICSYSIWPYFQNCFLKTLSNYFKREKHFSKKFEIWSIRHLMSSSFCPALEFVASSCMIHHLIHKLTTMTPTFRILVIQAHMEKPTQYHIQSTNAQMVKILILSFLRFSTTCFCFKTCLW